MVIDFTNRDLLTEDYLRAIGSWSKWLLNRMFGDNLSIGADLREEEGDHKNSNFIIRGKYRDIKAYAVSLAKERDYILTHNEYGEDHPKTVRVKAELDASTGHFTRLTGIEWPFK